MAKKGEESGAAGAAGGFNGAALVPVLVWPIVHLIGTADGLLSSLFVGVGGAVAMFFAAAMATGMLGGAAGRHTESIAWAVIVGLVSIYWWERYPWWGAAVLSGIGLFAAATLWRDERRGAPAEAGLPVAVEAAIAALSTPLPAPYDAELARATSAFTTLRRYALGELATLDSLRPAALVASAERSLRDLVGQIGRLIDMGEGAALAEARAAGRARLEAGLQSLEALRDQLLILAQARAASPEDALGDRLEAVRLAVASVRELEALEEAPE